MAEGKPSHKKSGDKKKPDFHSEPKSGRVGRLDEHTLGYYRRVSDTIKNGFENQEEKELMVANVFTQLNEEALKVSQNQTASTIVELLLKEATQPQLTAFLLALSADWETACTDRFAGYVVQTLLQRIKPYIKDSAEDQAPKALFLGLYRFLMGNMAVFMQDTYASHILRVVVEVLGGCQVSQKVIRSKVARQQEGKEIAAENNNTSMPQDFKEYLKSLAKKIFTMKRLKDHAENYLSNPVMQTVLLVLGKSAPELCPEMCQLLIANTDMFAPGVNNGLPTLLTHEVGSHLVEQLLAVCPAALYTTLLDVHLSPQLLPLALHRVGNYILQRLITNTHTPEQFETVFEKLSVNLEDVMAHNHIGIITSLAETCIRHNTRQQELLKALMKAFHCETPVERQLKLLPLLASFTTYDIFYKISEEEDSDEDEDNDESGEEENDDAPVPQLRTVNLHGSLLLQKLLNFSNPRPVVTSLLDLRPAELRLLACDKSGTYILEAFLSSQTIGDKRRDKLYSKLQGLYLDLACDRGGSRVIDALWVGATMKQKELIAGELSNQENKLRGNRYGHFVWRNLAIGHYVRRHKDWREIQNGSIRKRQLFQNILGDTQTASPTKKQRTSKDHMEVAAKKMQLEDPEDETVEDTSTAQVNEGAKKHEDKLVESAPREKRKNKKIKNKSLPEETKSTKKNKREVGEELQEPSVQLEKKKKKKKKRKQQISDE